MSGLVGYGRHLFAFALIFLLGGAVIAQESADPAKAFARGTAYFKAGSYQAALEAYLVARAGGLNSTKLRFNLASTYYRLGRYSDARREYMTLLEEPSIRALARYNVGLTYLKQRNGKAAAREFEQVIEEADKEALRTRAEKALLIAERVIAAQQPRKFRASKKSRRFVGVAEVGGGYEDNVTLAAEADQIGVSGEEDLFARAFGVGQLQIRGSRADGERLTMIGLVKRYEDVDEFDQAVGRLGFTVDRPLGFWTVSPGLEADIVFLGDDRFQTAGSFVFNAKGPIKGIFGAEVGYKASVIDAGSRFDSLSGQQHKVSASLLADSRLGDSELGYEFEYNDRDDFRSSAGEFFSRSPIYHKIFLAHESKHLENRLSIKPRVEYRTARYKDDEVRVGSGGGLAGLLLGDAALDDLLGLDGLLNLDDLLGLGDPLGGGLLGSGLEEKQRKDNRFKAELKVKYNLSKRLYAVGQYEYTENSSNFDNFEYERNAVGAGLGFTFR